MLVDILWDVGYTKRGICCCYVSHKLGVMSNEYVILDATAGNETLY